MEEIMKRIFQKLPFLKQEFSAAAPYNYSSNIQPRKIKNKTIHNFVIKSGQKMP
jgi:hypothetical protein